MACEALIYYPNPIKHKFVITPCGFTWQGYDMLLARDAIRSSRIMTQGDTATEREVNDICGDADRCISVFLKGDLPTILLTLKKSISLLNALPCSVTMTIYCGLPATWIYRMVLSLIKDRYKLKTIRIASLSHSCEDILHNDFPRLEDAVRLDEMLTGNLAKGLTSRELDVVLNAYRGISVKQQSEMYGLDVKTIYTHRTEGLRKLQFIQPWLKDVSFIRISADPADVESEKHSDRQSELIRALMRREIFPVYQVITDRNKKVVGFEILLRWDRNGEILKPVSFLTDLHDKKIWLQMTALVIDAAVKGINKYNGKYYFSVNIPPELAGGNALPDMAKKAVELLSKVAWAEKLVFEFAETIDVTQNKEIPFAMQRIRDTGCRLFLDDCFSSDYAMFPVRQIRFDGLKLDRDLVDKFSANEDDYSLIKAIQFYSDMTGGACVAEGVDSEDKFEKLAAAGVKSFQGYYLSKAVREKDLDRMIRQFS